MTDTHETSSAERSGARSDPPAGRPLLVRPREGRYLAGVCAGLGRATGTDPVLWRVLLVVLTCFGGIGLLVYLLMWLITPEEGDTASPIEGLFRQGQASVPAVLVVLLLVTAAAIVVGVAPVPLYVLLLVGVVVLVVALMLRNGRASEPPPGTPQTPPPSAAYAYPPGSGGPYAGAYPAGAGGPHAAGTAVNQPPRSGLSLITVSVMLLLFGGLALVELVGGVDIPAAVYVTAALVVTGLGLLVSTWWGRARALIAVGVILTLALPVAHGYQSLNRPEHLGAQVTWEPQHVSEIVNAYRIDLGEGVLDLRELDFDGRTVRTEVRARFGTVQVLLPPDVTVEARSRVTVGTSTVVDRSASGIRTSAATEVPGEPGAGTLQLDIRVLFGSVEVTR